MDTAIKAMGTTRVLLGGALLLSAMLLAAMTTWPQGAASWHLQDPSLHAVVETAGAVSALFVAVLLIAQCHQGMREALMYPVGLGFMAMGILDIFHALAGVASPGFVWLRGLAAFLGGLFPALSGLGWGPRLERLAAHRVVVIATSALGGFFLAHPDALPALDMRGGFVDPLNALNVAAGVLSFATAAYFAARYRRQPNADDLLFAGVYALLGCSAIIFPFSGLWSAPWWLWHALRLFAYGFSIHYMFGSHVSLLKGMKAEIRERTRVEAALRESEQQFRVLVEHAPEAIVLFDVGQNRLVDANTNAERLFGCDREELLRHSPDDFYRPPQPDELPPKESVRVRTEEALTGIPLVFERAIRNAQGKDVLCEVRLVKLPSADKKLVRGSYIDITERKEAQARIEFMAYHDALTGLPNRLLAKDHMELAMSFAERAHAQVALLFLDLDNFKTINDSLGHPVGDALLKAVATRLGESMRAPDTLARLGGDEFLIVLSDVRDAETITGMADAILERLAKPFDIEGQELTTSLSLGIAVYPDDGKDFETLLRKADTAMYHAKEAGKNTYRFHTEQMNVDAIEHLQMRNGLQKALARGELMLYYQPQIDLSTLAVTGVEALIRWNSPEGGPIPPMRFIPIAEDSGLIVPIGDWVLKEACRQAVAWRQAGLPELTVAVNLSAVQFRHGRLEKSVARALNESGLAANRLELELTESILIQDTENALATVRRLKAIGVKLSVDDFGTGYSSLAYLKRFDVDKLKIDQSFIRDMVDDPSDAAIVHAIIQMARSLNLAVIAEGVEDARMLAALREHGCDEAQGYHFAKPMPPEALAAYLSAMAEKPQGPA
ncbi:MAG: EAL domain-containing protein [Betaproteobacteria bacterium]|nr:EAL domain-containing protein [Betaproteobacteria bacterium]